MGEYSLLRQPFCEICSSPGRTTDQCTNSTLGHSTLSGFTRIRAVGSYYQRRTQKADLLTQHIWNLKTDREYSIPLGLAMALCLTSRYSELRNSDFVSPVPQHPDKMTQRGYNQALELARVLSDTIGMEVIETLEKTRSFSSTGKSRVEIEALTRGAYRCKTESLSTCIDKKILLVDDTATTGLDVSECSAQLKNAGSREVNVFVVGRTAWLP